MQCNSSSARRAVQSCHRLHCQLQPSVASQQALADSHQKRPVEATGVKTRVSWAGKCASSVMNWREKPLVLFVWFKLPCLFCIHWILSWLVYLWKKKFLWMLAANAAAFSYCTIDRKRKSHKTKDTRTKNSISKCKNQRTRGSMEAQKHLHHIFT